MKVRHIDFPERRDGYGAADTEKTPAGCRDRRGTAVGRSGCKPSPVCGHGIGDSQHAGHGGADGGAVSDSGVPESGINLAITQRLGGVLSFCGHTVALTREGEDALCDGTGTLRQQKVSDTKKRVELVNSFPHGFLISIHQNSLPGHPTVRGAQSFHNGKGTAETAALSIQQLLNSAVNEREKDARRMDDSIYLMKHADCSAVLVECGFLSNPEETVLLQQPDYQLHIAAAIAAGFCQYCTNEG